MDISLPLISMISTLLPLLFGIRLLKKQLPAYQLLWALFAVSAAMEVILFITAKLLHTENAWLVKYYTVIEYVLIVLLLARWHNNVAVSRLITGSIAFYLVVWVLIEFVFAKSGDAGVINVISRPAASLLLSVFVFMTLHSVWRQSADLLSQDFRFWTLIAMAIFYCASLIPISFLYIKNRELMILLGYAHGIVNILHNLLFCVGIYIGGKYSVPNSEAARV